MQWLTKQRTRHLLEGGKELALLDVSQALNVSVYEANRAINSLYDEGYLYSTYSFVKGSPFRKILYGLKTPQKVKKSLLQRVKETMRRLVFPLLR